MLFMSSTLTLYRVSRCYSLFFSCRAKTIAFRSTTSWLRRLSRTSHDVQILPSNLPARLRYCSFRLALLCGLEKDPNQPGRIQTLRQRTRLHWPSLYTSLCCRRGGRAGSFVSSRRLSIPAADTMVG